MRAGLLVLLVVSTGCGALFAPKMKSVQVLSNPPGAQVLVDGAPVGVTPGVVNVVNKKSHTVLFRLPGYQDGTCMLTADLKALWLILDLFGIVPLIVDAATGSWNEIGTSVCNVNLVPGGGAPPPPPPPPPPPASS